MQNLVSVSDEIKAVVASCTGTPTAKLIALLNAAGITASADIASASQTVTAHSTGNSQVNIQSIYTVSASSRIDFYGHNATAARGTVISTLTKLIYVRLY